jgi:hypothetical protein
MAAAGIAQTLSATGVGGAVVLLADSFIDTNGTALTSHTMDLGPGWTAVDSTLQVESDAATQGNANTTGTAKSDSGQSSVAIYGTINFGSTTNNNSIGLLGRFSDTNNYWYMQCNINAGVVRLAERNNGTSVSRGSASYSWSTNTNYAIAMVLSGANISLYINGSQKVTYSNGNTTNPNTTTHGILVNPTTANACWIFNFLVTSTPH